MRIKLTTLAAVSVATLVLTSCGSDDGGDGDDGDGATGDGATGGLAGEGTGDDCVIEGDVAVGAALSLTGAAASYGESQQSGLELAAKHLAEKGGVTYDLTIEDDQTDPRQGITVFEQFVGDDVSVIIGPTLSNGAFQAQPIAQEGGVPVLAISNTASGITAQGDYIFRDSLTEQQVIPQTIAAAKEAFGLERVAVLYGSDDAFTEGGYTVFSEVLESEGIEVTTTQTFAKGDTDFAAQLTEAGNTEPDALVVSALAEEGAQILTQAAELGLDVPVIGGNGFNSPAIIENAGEDAEGLIVGAAWNSASDNPRNAEFIPAYTEEFGAAPDQFAAQAYAGMNLLDAAVRQACSAEPQAIRDALAGLSGVDTVLGEFSFQENRDADHEAVVQVVENGEFAVLEQ